MASPQVITLIKLMRRLWLALALAIIVLVGVNLILSISGGKGREKEVKLDDTLFLEKKEKIQFQEVRKGAKEHLRVKAERHYLGEDELFHLEGGVEVVFPRKQKGEDVVIKSDSLIYDQEFNHFWTTGKAWVKWADVEIAAGRIDYFAPEEEFAGREGVKISTANWSVTANSFRLGIKTKKFECKGEVLLELINFMSSANSLVIKAQHLTYDRRSKIGLCQGGIWLEHGESQGQARQIEFKLGAQEGFIKWLTLRGEVKLHLKNEWPGNSPSASPEFSEWFYPESQEVEAEEIYIESFVQTKLIKIIKLINNVKIKFLSTNEKSSLLSGKGIDFFFTARGDLKEFITEGEARFVRYQEGKKITLGGNRLALKGKNKILVVIGSQNNSAFFDSPDLSFSAGRIEIKMATNDWKALEGVEATVKGKTSIEPHPKGFFDPERLVFLASQEMRSRRQGQRLVLIGEVKIWQGSRKLKAKRIVLERDSSRLEAQGEVEVNIIQEKLDPSQRELWIKGEEMAFEPRTRTMVMKQGITLEMGQVKMTSRQFKLYFDLESNELSRFEALDKVEMSYKRVKASAFKADYLYKSQSLILSGQPILEEPSRGKIRGDKLTFHLPDDRIVVENKGEERSIILIKS